MSARPSPRSLLAQSIVGREAILERLWETLDASDSGGHAVALVGEAGLGKTRLVKALLDRAQECGRLVLEGRASPLEAALPLGVLQDALRAERRTGPVTPAPDDPLAAAFPGLLLPEVGNERGPDVDRGVLFEAAARYLRARCAPAGLVLVLEDLHWADPTSHALIGHLARTTRDAPILLVLTYRPDEQPQSPSLDELRHELARARLGQELALAPLGDEDVASMLSDILGADAGPEVERMVADASGGNPFVVEELVRDAVEGGRLDPDQGQWRLDEPVALPATVQEMVLRRVRALSARDTELLRWAAVLGERFDPGLLAVVGGVTEQTTLAALGRLRDVGLMTDSRERADGRLAFRHALTRDAVLGDLLGSERRRRHARVLEVAEALPGEAPGLPLEEALQHALGAGDRAKSLAYSIQAGDRSADLGVYQEARAQYERALTLWRSSDELATRADLLMKLGHVTSIGGGLVACVIDARSREHFDAARTLYEDIGDTTSAALAAAGVVWSGRVFDVLDDLREARARLGPDAAPEAVCQILGCLAEREFLVGHPRAALRTSAEGLALLDARSGDDRSDLPLPGQLRRSFLLTSALATWWLGDAAGGHAAMLVLADGALGRNDYFEAAVVYQALSRASIDRPADALRHAERGLELTRPDEPMAAWLAHLAAQAHVHLGEWEAADSLLDRAEVLLAGMPEQPFLRHPLAMVGGELALGSGRIDRAIDALEPLAPEVDAIQGRIFKRVVRGTLARARLVEGDVAGARTALAPLIDRWEPGEEGPFVLSALLPMIIVEVASALGDEDEAAQWSAELVALGSGPRARYALGLAALTGGRPAEPRAIEAAARAVEDAGRRWEACWMRFIGAEAAARAGDLDQAGDLAAAALERFRAMQSEGWCRRVEGLLRRVGRRVPSRQSGRAAGGLTRREMEVLGLVADGASNHEIAERLFISKPTVARHVANIFAKFGARNRAEAVRVAGERGLLLSRMPTE